jgi:O-antigen/teichoic acid export membrane protein
MAGAVVALVHGPSLLLHPMVFGPRWAPAVAPFQILMLAFALRMSLGYSGDLFKVSGQTWVFPLLGLMNALVLTGACWVLTLWLGITGTALAVLALVVASLAPVQVLVLRWHGIDTCRILRAPVVGLAAATLAGLATGRWVEATSLIQAGLHSALLVALHFAVAWSLEPAIRQDVQLLRGHVKYEETGGHG